ncbi:TBC1 domain family member 4 [Eumeta japonica]|uniref:TBC1 domain family member 4 n=1 Tax=Eumeta variegata TaxID=151549 RepID=A0A4C1XVG6_EUMVA|nr:TBC1 domain family member 4 [Eumeta japonica]
MGFNRTKYEAKQNKRELKRSYTSFMKMTIIVVGRKKECITRKKNKKQKRYLLDSLKNLHQKFLNTSLVKIGYDSFCKLRPFCVVVPKLTDRERCPNIQISVIEDVDIEKVNRMIKEHEKEQKAFKGTLLVHQVLGHIYNPNKLVLKSLSCFCDNVDCNDYNLGTITYQTNTQRLQVSDIYTDSEDDMPLASVSHIAQEKSKTSYGSGDYVLVKLIMGRKEYRYAAICSKYDDDEGELTVTFLKVCNEDGTEFKINDNDIADVPYEDVIEKLPIPNLIVKRGKVFYKFKTPTSLPSDNSEERLSEDKHKTEFDALEDSSNRRVTITATPLEPDKSSAWDKSPDEDSKSNNQQEIDQEFDRFTKDRLEKSSNVSILKKPTPVPLEPNILILNVPKNNLTTLKEDEEKQEDLRSILSNTASSITQFCQQNFLRDLSPEETDVDIDDDKQKINNAFLEEITKDKGNAKDDTIKEPLRDPLFNIPITETKDYIHNKENIIIDKNIETAKDRNVREDSPLPNLNFDEISRKPKILPRSKSGLDPNEVKKCMMVENKPFLRDRSASIGTLNLKTPIAQVIGEQNRTMLFQVGRSELRLISPDRKQILLHRAFKDVASCVLGKDNRDHFGFVCRETAGSSESYACYVFKCESDSIATEVINVSGGFSEAKNQKVPVVEPYCYSKFILWPTYQHKNGPACGARHHTLAEYGREVAASAVPFRLVSESFGGRLPPILLPSTRSPSIRYSIPFQVAGNAPMISPGLRMFVSGGDHLLSDSSPAHLPPRLRFKKKGHVK